MVIVMTTKWPIDPRHIIVTVPIPRFSSASAVIV
jgi:hypothetical protein